MASAQNEGMLVPKPLEEDDLGERLAEAQSSAEAGDEGPGSALEVAHESARRTGRSRRAWKGLVKTDATDLVFFTESRSHSSEIFH